MNVKNWIILIVLCSAMVCVSISGCSYQGLRLKRMGDLLIEPIPSSRASFSDIIAEQKGDELVISGKVSRLNPAFSGAGHVDMAVVSPGGLVVCKTSVPYTPRVLPKTPGARKHRSARFEARLSCVPPRESIVRIAFHGLSDSPDDLSDCKENEAVPDVWDYGA